MRFLQVFIAAFLALALPVASFAQTATIYKEQGGARMVIGSGGSLDVASGGELDVESGGAWKINGTAVTATAAEINTVVSGPASYTLTPAAAGANVSEVTITMKGAGGAAVSGVHTFDVWLSDASTCSGLTGTSASGTVTAKAASGTVIGTYEAKKALRVATLTTGVFILEITDNAKTGFYVCAASPLTGKATASAQLTAGSYGP